MAETQEKVVKAADLDAQLARSAELLDANEELTDQERILRLEGIVRHLVETNGILLRTLLAQADATDAAFEVLFSAVKEQASKKPSIITLDQIR